MARNSSASSSAVGIAFVSVAAVLWGTTGTAQSLGAGRTSVIRRVMVPLMAGGILAGFVTSFITAAVELSATIMLASAQSQAPMSYGIYLYMQSISGRGPGAALGVLAVVVVGLGTYFSHRFVERSRATVQSTSE